MQSEALKPCPFCGGRAGVWQYDHLPDWRAGCDAEDCGYRPEQCFETQAEAIAAWNRRTPSEDLAAHVPGLVEALTVIGNASERSETMFGGRMSEVTRVFENITRVARTALKALEASAPQTNRAGE